MDEEPCKPAASKHTSGSEIEMFSLSPDENAIATVAKPQTHRDIQFQKQRK